MISLADFLTVSEQAVNPVILPFAILSGLVLAAVALSFVALFRATASAREASQRARKDQEQCAADVKLLRRQMDGLAAQLQEARQLPPSASIPALPKLGLNLSKRSQALRMHRRGDATTEIATSLGIPRQEVDLLLKVHRIIISDI